MPSLIFKNKAYEVDDEDFLVSPDQWDENFAEGMPPRVGISGELTASHWEVIKFIRSTFQKTGKCPMVYETARAFRLKSADLSRLFPSGYLRGACKLAGLTYRAEDIDPRWAPKERTANVTRLMEQKVYRVNVRGFLMNSADWDEDFAVYKSREMKMPEGLTEKHWQIIRHLREQFNKTGIVPTIYETCEANQIEVEDLGRLFPDGYHRGAVKIAGLRVI